MTMIKILTCHGLLNSLTKINGIINDMAITYFKKYLSRNLNWCDFFSGNQINKYTIKQY